MNAGIFFASSSDPANGNTKRKSSCFVCPGGKSCIPTFLRVKPSLSLRAVELARCGLNKLHQRKTKWQEVKENKGDKEDCLSKSVRSKQRLSRSPAVSHIAACSRRGLHCVTISARPSNPALPPVTCCLHAHSCCIFKRISF